MTQTLPLTNSPLVAIVDAEDFDFVSRKNWYLHDGYPTTHIRNKRISLHSFVFQTPPPGYQIDHKDGSPLNNSKLNLRHCKPSENAKNVKKRDGVCASRYKGVTWHKQAKKWQVYICHNGKHIYLGLFKDESEAAKAYNAKSKELHGEYSRPNTILMEADRPDLDSPIMERKTV